MKKPKLLIIVLFQNLKEENPYYARTPAPPLPGILLAALTPPEVEVEVLHEMVRPIDYRTDADFIALSFMDYLAPHAFEVAAAFRARGKVVIGGGKFASTFPDAIQQCFDSILVGEAHGVWADMVRDLLAGRLKPRYVADGCAPLAAIPPPRYDLVERRFAVPIVTEASRGCPHPCTYCQLNIVRLPFRVRPVDDVVRDLAATTGLPWHRRRMAMILDNNLGGDLSYAKDLLRAIAPLGYWAIGVQFSIECLRDLEFVDLLGQARCRMAFIGMESLSDSSLAGVGKRQNVVSQYHTLFHRMHERGILTFVGLMFALEEDTVEYYETLPDRLREVGVSAILPSISIPLYGTPWYRQVQAEGRITDPDLSHYEGDHLVFRHTRLSDEQVFSAYRRVTGLFYRWGEMFRRWWRFIRLQKRTESRSDFLLRLAVSTLVYAEISWFQKHHARHRVFKPLGRSNGAESIQTAHGPRQAPGTPALPAEKLVRAA
jgi:radical SAM superfamily enzyme YgiQ (UPF0313 family)